LKVSVSDLGRRGWGLPPPHLQGSGTRWRCQGRRGSGTGYPAPGTWERIP